MFCHRNEQLQALFIDVKYRNFTGNLYSATYKLYANFSVS